MRISMFVFFKQKSAYEMRISDWSSDVCSSDLAAPQLGESFGERHRESQEGRSRILFECSRPKSQLVQARAECSDMHHILGTGWRSGFACGGSHLVEQWSRRSAARPPFPFL